MVTTSGALLSPCPIVSPVSVFVEGAEPVDPAPQQEPAHPHPGALAVRVAEPGQRRSLSHYPTSLRHATQFCRDISVKCIYKSSPILNDNVLYIAHRLLAHSTC